MNVFIIAGLIMTIAGLFMIMVSSIILTTYWAIHTAKECKHGERDNVE